jgi:hypothetical protein
MVKRVLFIQPRAGANGLFALRGNSEEAIMPALHLATFACDVTPPLGHPLCGGWIEPARAVDDPLWARGVVLLGSGAPVVLCSVDWCGLRNEANRAWREALAQAAHTTPERVTVHCVHPHNTPFADTEAQKLIEATPGAPISLDLKFFDQTVKRAADAAQRSLAKPGRFTHVGAGRAKVEQVASNRRILGDDGKIKFTRTSATRKKEVRDAPEGLTDPWLRTVSFWDGDTPRAALSYYATHPMSYYGDGRISSDFCGLARQKRQAEVPDIFQVYFTGCSGNITAGKYNDGSRENRPILRDRIYTAMKAAWAATKRHPVKEMAWRVEPVKFGPRKEKSFGAEASLATLRDPKATKARRNNAAFQLAWLKRIDRPVDITCLDLGPVLVLHLPGECFIEYQLKAQEVRKDRFVAVASYGDGGMGYIPTNRAFFEGGYEPTVALASPCEGLLTKAITRVLQGR